jgi:hypothetical protein
MRERDRLAIQAHREEIQSLERAERERIEAPIKAAQAEINRTVNELAKVYRQRLLGTVRDPDPIGIDPSVTGIRMPRVEADAFNRREFAKYKSEHPDVFWTQELLENLGAYFAKQGLQIITAGMIESLVDRYRACGLLPDRPEPEPIAEPITERESAKPTQPEVFEGWDLDSGEPRTFTRREVDRMSADEYRRVFRIYKEHLGLPNVGPGARRQL